MKFDPATLRHAIGSRAPRWPFRIDRGNVQARGLQYWWPFIQPGEGRTIHELVRGSHATFDASMDAESWVSTPFEGRAVAFDGTAGDEATVADEDGLSFPATDCALTFWFRAGAWSSGKGLIGKWVSGDREWLVWCQTTTNALEFARYVGAGYFPTTLTNAAFYDGTPTFVCARTLKDGSIDIAAWKPSLGLVKSTPGAAQSWNTTGAEPLTFGSYGKNAAGNELACDIWDVRKHTVAPTDGELLHRVLPETRWGLFERRRVPRAWPNAAGGAAVRTLTGSLDAAARKQIAVAASLTAGVSVGLARAAAADAALAGLVAATSDLDAALARVATGQATADAVLRAARALTGAAEAALAKAIGAAASLDASVTGAGVGLRGAALDAAVERLVSLAMTLNAALARLNVHQAGLDAGLAIPGMGPAAVDGIVARLDILTGLALEAAVRHSVDLTAVFDAVIGAVVAPSAGRTFRVPARGGHAVARDLRTLVIPGGNRRH